jgi:hypothetical protein
MPQDEGAISVKLGCVSMCAETAKSHSAGQQVTVAKHRSLTVVSANACLQQLSVTSKQRGRIVFLYWRPQV